MKRVIRQNKMLLYILIFEFNKIQNKACEFKNNISRI